MLNLKKNKTKKEKTIPYINLKKKKKRVFLFLCLHVYLFWVFDSEFLPFWMMFYSFLFFNVVFIFSMIIDFYGVELAFPLTT